MEFPQLQALLESEKGKLNNDQIHKIIKCASFGCRIIADGKIIFSGVQDDGQALAQKYAATWKADGAAFLAKIKSPSFSVSQIEIKEYRKGRWEKGEQTIQAAIPNKK